MIGKTISHYKILVKLGEGGMGRCSKSKTRNLAVIRCFSLSNCDAIILILRP